MFHKGKKEFKDKYVSLSIGYDPNREKKIISCMFCTRFLYVETGDVKAISEGESYEDISKILQCRSCKTNYILNQKIDAGQVVK